MTSTSPRLLAAAAGLTVALALTGCGTTLRTGAAAVVGDDRITSTRLQQVIDRGLADPQAQQSVGADRTAFTRSVLLRLISHDLLVAAATQQGVSVDNGAVDAAQDRIAAQLGGVVRLKAEAAKAGIGAADLRQTLSDVALRDALADKLTADVPVDEAKLRAAYQAGLASFDQVHSAHILVATKALAQQLLGQAKADPGSFKALAAQYSSDSGSKDKGGDLGFQGRGALEKPFEAAIFGNPAGSFVLARTRYGFHVIHILERRTTTFDQARDSLRRGLLGQARQDAVNALLTKTATRLGVKVNPRYGAWDAAANDVVAAKDRVSKPAGGTASAPAAAPAQ